jgi:hypothetical protein
MEATSHGRSATPPQRYFAGVVGALDAEWDRKVSHQIATSGAAQPDVESHGDSQRQSPAIDSGNQGEFIIPEWSREAPVLAALVFVGISICVLVPLAINEALSLSHQGTVSTLAQRVWTMTWLSFGVLLGVMLGMSDLVLLLSESYVHAFSMLRRYVNGLPIEGPILGSILKSTLAANVDIYRHPVLIAIPYSAAAIGGMVVVTQMLLEYGVCIKIA